MPTVTIDTQRIMDWPSFHQVFAEALNFPEFYGRNMDAWIDCLSDLHEEFGLCQVKVGKGEMVHLRITDTSNFYARQPDIMKELVECAASVNYRSVQAGEGPKLSLIFINHLA